MRLAAVVVSLAPLIGGPLIAGSVEGRVTNSVTGEPIAGVTVRSIGPHSYVYQTVTDASGSYRLTGLDDGKYGGEFSKDGFSGAKADSRTVTGDAPARADARINPWGSLRGRVVDEDGNPVSGARVEISANKDTATIEDGEFVFDGLWPASYTVVTMAGQTVNGRLGWSTRCTPDGQFVFPDLPPGEYTLLAYQGTNDAASPGFQGIIAAQGQRVKVEAGETASITLQPTQ